MGQAGSFSSFFDGKRFVPKRLHNAYKAVAAQMYQTNSSGVADTVSGKQQSYIVGSAFCGNGVYTGHYIQSDLASFETAVQNFVGGNARRKVLFESICDMNIRVILYS